MTASRVTPLTDEEGVDVDEAKEARGVAVLICDRFDRSWASLRLTVVASMAHIAEKCVDLNRRQKNGGEFA